MLLDTVRTYFTLNAKQQAEEEQLLQSSGYGEVRELFKTEFEKFEEEVERRVMRRDKQDVLLLQMSEKFGSVPEALAARVRAVEDPKALDRLLRKLIHAANLDAMGL